MNMVSQNIYDTQNKMLYQLAFAELKAVQL